MQVEANEFNPAEGLAGVTTTNAASSDVYGVDADATWTPAAVEGLALTAALNWNHAEYHKFPDAECWTGQTQSEGCNVDQNGDGIGDAQDLKGADLLRAPEWMANFGIRYETPVFDGMTLALGSNTSYSDSYSASSTNIPYAEQDSYVKTSASISLTSRDERWRVEVIGDNLTDELVFGNCAPSGYKNTLLLGTRESVAGTGTVNGGLGGKPETACWADRGRSVWMRLTWNFM